MQAQGLMVVHEVLNGVHDQAVLFAFHARFAVVFGQVIVLPHFQSAGVCLLFAIIVCRMRHPLNYVHICLSLPLFLVISRLPAFI